MSWMDRLLHWIAVKPVEAVGVSWAAIGLFLWPIAVALPNAPALLGIVLVLGSGTIVVVEIIKRLVKKRCYTAIVLSWDNEDVVPVLDAAERYFAENHIPKALPKPLVRVKVPNAEWQSTLDQANDRLQQIEHDHETHLVCRVVWLWAYALGSRLQDRLPLVVYHFQGAAFHPIWKVSREIKDRISAEAGTYKYKTTGGPEEIREGTRKDAAIVVFDCGMHRAAEAVLEYRESQSDLAALPVWSVGIKGGLDSKQPGDWADAAADLAVSIEHVSNHGTRELYFFGVMPAVLGLMAGMAVGPYRRIHLMQYDGKTYAEAMELRPMA